MSLRTPIQTPAHAGALAARGMRIGTRIAFVGSVFCLSIAAASGAADSPAVTRQLTSIPEQPLDDALQALAKQRDVQMIYPYAAVDHHRSSGARGDLTVAEALDQLLAGTGLRYRYLDDRTITIAAGQSPSSEKAAHERGVEDTVRSEAAVTARLPADPSTRGQPVVESKQPLQVEEVIVTALRREQRLQEVPAAVAVLSGQEIKAMGAQDMRDYLTTIPGVTYAENNVGGMRVTIRGIADGFVGTTEPLTGIYIDEAPVTESAFGSLDPDIYDVERVEVLKGPQGTLYGSGSMGGTVRIIGKKPQLDAFDAELAGAFSTIPESGSGDRVDGVINVPIQDALAVRMSAGFRGDGGWIDDVPHNHKDANTIEKHNVRAQLLWEAAERTSVILGFLYQDEDRGLPPFDDFALPHYKTGKTYRQRSDARATLTSLTLRHDWDGISLTSASNYLEKDSDVRYAVGLRSAIERVVGVTLTPSDGIGLKAFGSISQFTQEVRVASTEPSRLGWLFGAFYSDATTHLTEAIDVSQAPSLSHIISGDAYHNGRTRFDTRQVAGFGELTFNVTDKVSVTGGLRTSDVQQRHFEHSSGLLTGGESLFDASTDQSSTTKKLLVQYQADPDHLVYAQAVQGYRNGGANGPVPVSTCGPELAAAGYTRAAVDYGPDNLWSYEIGAKNTLRNGSLQLNAAAFYVDWSDIQNTVGLTCGLTFVTNAGQAASKGVEFEAAFKPLQGLTFDLSASYIDATLTGVAPGVAATEGDPLPLTAKWSGNASALYERKLPGSLTAFVQGDMNYVGRRWNNFRSVRDRAVLMDDYATVSARFGLRTTRWSAAFFGTNLTDERIVFNVNPPSYELVGRPRTLGIEAQVGF